MKIILIIVITFTIPFSFTNLYSQNVRMSVDGTNDNNERIVLKDVKYIDPVTKHLSYRLDKKCSSISQLNFYWKGSHEYVELNIMCSNGRVIHSEKKIMFTDEYTFYMSDIENDICEYDNERNSLYWITLTVLVCDSTDISETNVYECFITGKDC
jgi:hypothetical protein